MSVLTKAAKPAAAGAGRAVQAVRAGRRVPVPGRPPRHGDWAGEAEDFIDRLLRDVSHGRFERSLSGLTAAAAVITTAEIYIEHYKASFGNKWMWSPILVTPPVVAVPNLFLADGSVCPTQGSANPALTIMALASRLADQMASGDAMDESTMTASRTNLS